MQGKYRHNTVNFIHQPDRRGLGDRLRRVGLTERERDRERGPGLTERERVGLRLLLDCEVKLIITYFFTSNNKSPTILEAQHV